jgi:hypothetical protein
MGTSADRERRSAWKRSGTFAVSLDRYDGNFRDTLSELTEGRSLNMAIVRIKPYGNFKKWWPAMDSTFDDRHFYPGLVVLAERGDIPQSILSQDYDSTYVIGPHLKRLGLTWEDVAKLGMDRMIAALMMAIESGRDVPPLVTRLGRPADGRHRTLAAMRLGLKKAPVMEVSEMFVDDSRTPWWKQGAHAGARR